MSAALNQEHSAEPRVRRFRGRARSSSSKRSSTQEEACLGAPFFSSDFWGEKKPTWWHPFFLSLFSLPFFFSLSLSFSLFFFFFSLLFLFLSSFSLSFSFSLFFFFFFLLFLFLFLFLFLVLFRGAGRREGGGGRKKPRVPFFSSDFGEKKPT